MQDHQSAPCPAANTQAASERCFRTGEGLEDSGGRLVQCPYQPHHHHHQLLPCPSPPAFCWVISSVTALPHSRSQLGEDAGWAERFHRVFNCVAVETTRTQNFWRSDAVVNLSSKMQSLEYNSGWRDENKCANLWLKDSFQPRGLHHQRSVIPNWWVMTQKWVPDSVGTESIFSKIFSMVERSFFFFCKISLIRKKNK